MESHHAGPRPLDKPAFPDEFVDKCRAIVRKRTVAHAQRQRARLVLLLHESPDLSNVAAGALVELHANSVYRWRHRWACGNFSRDRGPALDLFRLRHPLWELCFRCQGPGHGNDPRYACCSTCYGDGFLMTKRDWGEPAST